MGRPDGCRPSLLLQLAVLLLIGGCTVAPPTAEGVANAVKRQDSAFDLLSSIAGPEVFELVPRGMLNDQLRWRIHAQWIKGSATPGAYRLVASVWHQDRSWRFYRSASFVGGMVVPAARVDSKPSCMSGGGLVTCSYTEIVSVPLTADHWRQARTDGLEVRLNADRGAHVIVKIPPAYAQGFDQGAAAK